MLGTQRIAVYNRVGSVRLGRSQIVRSRRDNVTSVAGFVYNVRSRSLECQPSEALQSEQLQLQIAHLAFSALLPPPAPSFEHALELSALCSAVTAASRSLLNAMFRVFWILEGLMNSGPDGPDAPQLLYNLPLPLLPLSLVMKRLTQVLHLQIGQHKLCVMVPRMNATRAARSLGPALLTKQAWQKRL